VPEDFYDLLGVDADADRERIKRAHREQVREYHPDHNDDERADDQFKAVQRAYEVLSDADKRAAYDRLGHEEYVRERLGGDPTVRRATNMDAAPDASGDAAAAGASTGTAADADGGTTDTGGVGGATTNADGGTASQGAGGGTASRGTAGRTPTDVEMGYRAWRRKRRRHHRAAVVGAIAGALLAAAGAVPFLSAHPELVEAARSPTEATLRTPASVVPSGREWLLPGGTAALAAALSVEARLHGGAAWLLPLLSLGPAAVAGAAAVAGTAIPTGAVLAGVVAPAPAVAGWLVTRPWRTP
jgi:hypothetical protein